MGCGCGKGKRSGPLPQVAHQSSAGPVAKRVAVYEVMVSGETKLSTTSPSAARTEAKRLGGSVRVSSRAVEQELVS